MAEENRPRELLGDRAGPFAHGALPHIGHHRPGNAPAINAIVFIKTSVFSSNEGLLNQQRHVAGLELFPGCRPQFLDDLPTGREQGDGARPIEAGDAAGIGQR